MCQRVEKIYIKEMYVYVCRRGFYGEELYIYVKENFVPVIEKYVCAIYVCVVSISVYKRFPWRRVVYLCKRVVYLCKRDVCACRKQKRNMCV